MSPRAAPLYSCQREVALWLAPLRHSTFPPHLGTTAHLAPPPQHHLRSSVRFSYCLPTFLSGRDSPALLALLACDPAVLTTADWNILSRGLLLLCAMQRLCRMGGLTALSRSARAPDTQWSVRSGEKPCLGIFDC